MAGRRRIGADALLHVRTIDARCRHLDQYLPRTRLGRRQAARHQHLGSTRLADLHGRHGLGHSVGNAGHGLAPLALLMSCRPQTCPSPRVETRPISCQARTRRSPLCQESVMDWDELKPKPPKAITVGEDLKTLSVAELEARIVTFTAEIERVRRSCRRRRRTRPPPRPCSSADNRIQCALSSSAAGRFALFYSLMLIIRLSSPLDSSGSPTLFDASLLTPEPPSRRLFFCRLGHDTHHGSAMARIMNSGQLRLRGGGHHFGRIGVTC